MLYDLESHAKDGRCVLSRNENIRRYVGKLVEKQTVVQFHLIASAPLSHDMSLHEGSMAYS